MSEETTERSEKNAEDSPELVVIKPYCPITVEPILFLMVLGGIMTATLQPQYIYYRITNGTVNQQGSSCYGNSSNSSAYEEGQSAQVEVTQWTTALQLSGAIPALVVGVMIGSVSDKLGRKLNLIIPIVGFLIKFILGALVVQFNLPLAVLLPGSFIQGLTGENPTLIGGTFAYIADITVEGNSRYFRHALLQAVFGTGVIISALVGNLWFQRVGFPFGILQPFWFAAGVTTFSLIYTIFGLKETCPSKPGSQLCALSNITGIIQLFKVKRKTPTWPIAVLCLTFFLLYGVYNTAIGILITYTIGPPFCWPPDYVGYLQVGLGAGTFVSVIAIKIYSKYPFGMITAGYISGIGGFVLWGLAAYTPNPDVALFTATAIGCLQASANSLLRTTMSKMVGPEEQGSLFGLISFTTTLATVAFVPLWNFVYGSTITFMPGLVFLAYAGVTLVCALLSGFVKFMVPPMIEENLLKEDDEGHDNEGYEFSNL